MHKPNGDPETSGTTSSLNFHMGEAFIRVASDYPTLLDIILEQVQNALDANARKVWIVLNRKTRHIAIRDDGDGVSREGFELALQGVCQSQKERGKLGRFGIGLISPLDKCATFTFISSVRGEQNFMEWTFTTSAIREQERNVTIPCRYRTELYHIKAKDEVAPKGRTTVLWNTEVNILKYSEDKLISRIKSIDALADAIFDRFGTVMRAKKVLLNLKFSDESGNVEVREDIKPKRFSGRSLGTIAVDDPSAGRVTFRLYLAQKTTKGQHGKVLVGEADNDFRFGFNMHARTAEGLLSEDVASALLSGVFEGEIVGEKITLESTRRSFVKDDAFLGFCTAMEKWYERRGKQYIEEANEARRDQRYQELGLESLQQIEELLRDARFSDIRSVLKSFKLGTVGRGSAPVSDEKVLGIQDEHALSTSGANTNGDGEDKPEEEEKDKAAEPNPKHAPYTAAGPLGKQRTVVKGKGLGLQFSYLAMDGSDKLWELDVRQGILHFNVNHPDWVACDVSDRKVRQLQETVAIYALMLLAMPDEYADTIRFAFDEALRPLLHLYHVSPSFNLRKRTKHTREKSGE